MSLAHYKQSPKYIKSLGNSDSGVARSASSIEPYKNANKIYTSYQPENCTEYSYSAYMAAESAESRKLIYSRVD